MKISHIQIYLHLKGSGKIELLNFQLGVDSKEPISELSIFLILDFSILRCQCISQIANSPDISRQAELNIFNLLTVFQDQRGSGTLCKTETISVHRLDKTVDSEINCSLKKFCYVHFICFFVCFVLVFWPPSMWDPYSRTRDSTHTPCTGSVKS